MGNSLDSPIVREYGAAPIVLSPDFPRWGRSPLPVHPQDFNPVDAGGAQPVSRFGPGAGAGQTASTSSFGMTPIHDVRGRRYSYATSISYIGQPARTVNDRWVSGQGFYQFHMPRAWSGSRQFSRPLQDESFAIAIQYGRPRSTENPSLTGGRTGHAIVGFNHTSADPNSPGISVEVPSRFSTDRRVFVRIGSTNYPFPGLELLSEALPNRTGDARSEPLGILFKFDVTPLGLRITAWHYRLSRTLDASLRWWGNPPPAPTLPTHIVGPFVFEHRGITPEGRFFIRSEFTGGDPETSYVSTPHWYAPGHSVDTFGGEWDLDPIAEMVRRVRWAQRDDYHRWGNSTAVGQGFRWGGGAGYR